MRIPLVRVGLCMSLLYATACVSAADPDFDARLREADALRTSDSAQSSRILAELELEIERGATDTTLAQRRKLDLLNAYRLSVTGDLQGAIRKLKPLLDDSAGAELHFRAGALLANTYALTREFPEGLAVLERILPRLDEVKEREARHQGLLAASILYNRVGQYKLGGDYADKVLSERASGRSLCFAGNLRLEAMQNLGSGPDDGAYAEAISLCQAVGEPIATNLVRTYLARKWYTEGNVSEALNLLESHLAEVKAIGYVNLIAEFHALIAEYRMASGDDAGAALHAGEVIQLRAELLHTLPLVMGYRTLYMIAEKRGDMVAALALHKQYAEADKANLNEVKARELAYQIVRHEALQQTQQIALLNQQNELLQLQQRVQKQEAQSARLVMMMLLLLLATLGLWTFKTKRMQMSLKRMAETDALTGICNRHHFNLRAEQLLGQCKRSGEEVALVMFDLDHFKAINDRYGHASGDWVLRQVAQVCTPLCREVDVFGRLGGEEFAILLPGQDLRTARRMADDCRMRLAGIDTSGSGDVFRVTASFGVATSQLSGDDLSRLMSDADRMLYRAKRGGRNRVCVFEGRVSPTLAIPVRAAEDSLLATDDAPSPTETDTGHAAWTPADKPRNVATS